MSVAMVVGEEIAQYGFPDGHPFGTHRHAAFWKEALRRGLDKRVSIRKPTLATREELERFHTPEYVDRVIRLSAEGDGYLDYGDTPAYPGVFEAAAHVVGSTLDLLREIMEGRIQQGFVPIAGLHHARRDRAGGFCVFNDCGIVIETLRKVYGIKRVAYVDIDAHHGDGVFYAFEEDPDLIFADLHEDGRFLYPGTGFAHETGKGAAVGTKINLPLPPGANDDLFHLVWPKVESFLEEQRPDFFVMQCGADSVEGDPITHMAFSPQIHGEAAKRIRLLAEKLGHGRVLATGGGGYNPRNIGQAWCEVVEGLLG